VAKLTIPVSPSELEEMLNDTGILSNLMDEGQFPDFIKAYAGAVNQRDGEISQQIKDEVQRGLADFVKANGGTSTPVNLNPLNATHEIEAKNLRKHAIFNQDAPGAAVEKVAFKNTADFFRMVNYRADELHAGNQIIRNRIADQRRQVQEIMNSFGSAVPADGGFLIPETLRSQLLMVALETAVVRPRATVIPMESLRVPIPMVDSTTNNGSVYGGIVCYWTEESAALTESQAAFGRIVLDAKKLTAFANVPNELPADASAFGGFIDQAFPKAISFFEDVAFMKGTGVGEPLGFIGCPATVTAAAVSGQGANTIVYQNLVAMYARMLPSSLGSAVWIASIDTFPQLATMALSVGTGGSAVWLGGGGLTNGASATPPVTILGRPVFFTEKANTLGTAGDISFCDLSYYLLGDRMSMVASSSPHYRFNQDQTSYRIIQRVDGRPWIQSAITPQNGGNTLSPFVNLSSTRT
jgi:HK97 family phage major capsid protein